jgi:hypothetical protein
MMMTEPKVTMAAAIHGKVYWFFSFSLYITSLITDTSMFDLILIRNWEGEKTVGVYIASALVLV